MNKHERFLCAKTFAVAGASSKPHKYGNKVFSALLSTHRDTFALNPRQIVIDGHQAYAKIADLPIVPEALSMVTQPEVTREVVQEAIAAGVKHIWMQPGAEDEKASTAARDAGINVIDDGSCILVLLACG